MLGNIQSRMAGTKGKIYSPPLSEEEIRDIKKALAEVPEHRCAGGNDAAEWLDSID